MQTSVDSTKLEMKNVHILKNANHVRALPHSTILILSTGLHFQCRKVERQHEQGQGPRSLLRDLTVVKL
jgi:hypothetical protein